MKHPTRKATQVVTIFLKRSNALWWGLLVISLILICIPRFNRSEWLLPAPPADDVQYVLYVEYFRGHDVADQLRIASTWRPLIPLLASLLPWAPMTAINAVNVLSLLIALVFLYGVLKEMQLSEESIWAGCILFVFSFPTFYYGAIGYVDPGLICFLMIGTFLIVKARWVPLGILILAGTFLKEGIVVLIPVACVYFYLYESSWSRRLIYPVLYSALYLAASVLIRKIAPGTAHTVFWEMSTDVFLYNATRLRTWLSLILTIGIPGGLACTLGFQWRRLPQATRDVLLPFFVGFVAVLATWVYAMVAAHADGRTLWATYPFSIPIAAFWIDLIYKKRGLTSSTKAYG